MADLLTLTDCGLYSPQGDFYIDPWLPVAVRFPRMARWRRDKTAEEADTLDAVRKLAELVPQPPEQPLLF